MTESRFWPRTPGVLHFRKRRTAVGARPGTLVTASDSKPPVVHVLSYGPDDFIDVDITNLDERLTHRDDERMSWIDVQGLGDEPTLQRIGEIFELHPLALEDAVNIPQRPKSEGYELHHLFITRMARMAEGSGLEAEQVSIFIGPRYILTLQESYGDVFDPIRKRIRTGKGIIRKMGPDYLAMRRAVWPQREAVNALIREETPLVSDTVRQYLRDCHDHAVQIADVVETYRELATSLMDIYLSSMSQRTNEVMKVLTIMSSIFIPLTFLAGIYGMNFVHMPELQTAWAYPALLGTMVVMTAGMLLYFRRKGWIGKPDDDDEESEH